MTTTDLPVTTRAETPVRRRAAHGAGGGRGGTLVRTATALMTSTVSSAALGFLFWVVAARWFPPERVGSASAVVSSMSLLGGLAQLNLTSLYARFLPTAGSRSRRLVLTGYAASAAMAVLLGAGFLAFGPGSELTAQPFGGVIFTVAVVTAAIFFIQDGVLAALRRPSWVPVKNVLASGAKLALLPILAGLATGSGLVLAWIIPMLVAMLAVNWWILARLTPAQADSADTTEAIDPREVAGFASAEYVNGLLTNTVAFLPPVLVAAVLGPAPSAYFYIPWVIGVAATTMLWNIVTSFVVAASSDGESARGHVHRALALIAAVVGPATVVLAGAATPLLRILGADYAAQGATGLRLIGLSLPFTGVILLYAAFAMMEKRMWRMVAVQLVSTAGLLAGSWFGLPRIGLVAPALALLVSQAAMALVLLPDLIRRYRALAPGRAPAAWGAAACTGRAARNPAVGAE